MGPHAGAPSGAGTMMAYARAGGGASGPDGHDHFHAALSDGHDVTVMVLDGAFDLAAYEQFMQTLARAVAGDRPVEIDTSGVTLIDSTGLRGLLQARNLLGAERVLLVNPSGKVCDLLAMSGTRHLFHVSEAPRA